ncbi:MAG: hypothetical protein ABR562_02025, partial [Thermoplasmatota archaeon]
EEAFHLGTGHTGLRRVVQAGKIPTSILQKYVNHWVPTAFDLFGKDESGTVRLGFGRHAGRAAAEVPEYLAWMLEEDFPERTKRQVRRVLEERPLLA